MNNLALWLGTLAAVISAVVAIIQMRYMKRQPSASGSGQSAYERRTEQQPAPTGLRRIWHAVSPWIFGTWQVFCLVIVFLAIVVDPEAYKNLGPGFIGDFIVWAIILALNGLGAALGYQFSRRPRELRSATKRGYVYLALAVLNILLIIDLLALLASAGNPQPAPQTTDEARTPASPLPASKPPVSSVELADALLTPADLSNLGRLVVLNQQSGTGAGVTSSGLTHSITFVRGDPACKAVVEAHPVVPAAWAWVEMADNPDPAKSSTLIDEDIEAFASESDARRVMQQNLDQVVDCRSFIGDTEVPNGTSLRMTYKHRKISVPVFGEEVIAHQIDGEAKDGSYVVWNFVEIRSGSDVIFIDYSPAEQGTGHTGKIATAAWKKYSRVR